MRDVFYTILTVWIIWRIVNAISVYSGRKTQYNSPGNQGPRREEGKTSVDYIPPLNKKIKDDEGEYVDYEEIK